MDKSLRIYLQDEATNHIVMETSPKKVHNCPDCICPSPKNERNKNQQLNSKPINNTGQIYYKMNSNLHINANSLLPKVVNLSNLQFQRVQGLVSQPLPSLYLSKQNERINVSNSSRSHDSKRVSVKPGIILLSNILNNRNSVNNTNIVYRTVSSRPASPNIRPLSPVNVSNGYMKPKVTIRYLSPPQSKNQSFSPRNSSYAVNAMNSKISLYSFGESKNQALVKNTKRESIEVNEQSPIKKVASSRKLEERNNMGYTNIYTSKNQNISQFQIMNSSTGYQNNLYRKVINSDSRTLSNSYALSLVNQTPTKVQNANRVQIKTYNKNVIGSHRNQIIGEQIVLKCDEISSQKISDRSISDDVQL